MVDINKGGLLEENEFSDKTQKIGKKLFEDLQPSIEQIEEEQTHRNMEGQNGQSRQIPDVHHCY